MSRRGSRWTTDKPPFGAAEVDRNHPLGEGVVAHWVMNEGTGQLYSMPGSLVSSPSTAMSGVFVVEQGRLCTKFTGDPQHVNFGNQAPLNITGPFTLIGWCRRNSALAYNVPITRRGGSGGSQLQYQLTWLHSGETPANGVRLDWRTGGNLRTLNSTSAYTTSAWHQLAATYDLATARLFVQGLQDGSASVSGAVDTFSVNNYLGQDGDVTPNYSVALFDNVSIYRTALIPANIQWLYAEPYAFLRPKVPRRYFVPAAAAPTGTIRPRRGVLRGVGTGLLGGVG